MDIGQIRAIKAEAMAAKGRLLFDKTRWLPAVPDFEAHLFALDYDALITRLCDIDEDCIVSEGECYYKYRRLSVIEAHEQRIILRLKGLLSLWKRESFRAKHPDTMKDFAALLARERSYVTRSGDYSLFVGESYEEGIAAFLRAEGVEAIRWNEDIPDGRFRQLQRDLGVRDGKGVIHNIELKALRSGSYKPQGILVGDVGKWDLKLFDVTAVIVVHQDTGEILWAAADVESQRLWRRWRGQAEDSYIVPLACWKPIECFIENMR